MLNSIMHFFLQQWKVTISQLLGLLKAIQV